MKDVRVVLALLFAAGSAHAEGPKNALSLQVPSVFVHGVAGQYERAVWQKFSFAAGLGLRSGAAGDFESRTVSLGAEARVWIRQDWNQAGPYAGARLDLARHSLRDELDDRMVGASWAVDESLHAGWRFTIKQRVEITPSAGIGLRHEFTEDGRLASWTKGMLLFGLTAGALF